MRARPRRDLQLLAHGDVFLHTCAVRLRRCVFCTHFSLLIRVSTFSSGGAPVLFLPGVGTSGLGWPVRASFTHLQHTGAASDRLTASHVDRRKDTGLCRENRALASVHRTRSQGWRGWGCRVQAANEPLAPTWMPRTKSVCTRLKTAPAALGKPAPLQTFPST